MKKNVTQAEKKIMKMISFCLKHNPDITTEDIKKHIDESEEGMEVPIEYIENGLHKILVAQFRKRN